MFRPQNACILRATLPQPPWKKPLNWSLHVTIDGEERIPFHLYVRPSAAQTALSLPFSNLPVELQLHILSFCSAPTLFQIMRVSSRLRIEASKLFWADPNTFYLIELCWLLEGGYPGSTCYDMPFLSEVQNIKVEHQRGEDDKIGPLLDDGTRKIRHDLVRRFWDTVKKRFPRVRRMVISQNWESISYDKSGFPCVKILVESCPLQIDISAIILEQTDPRKDNSNNNSNNNSDSDNNMVPPPTNERQQSLYQYTPHDGWRRLLPCPRFKTILMPMKRFHGPVGEFEGLRYISNRLTLRHFALGPLIIEAVDRHYFGEGRQVPFSCPVLGCDGFFNNAGQWTVHATEAHNVGSITQKRFEILPTELIEVFKGHERGLEVKGKELAEKTSRMYNKWNKEGAEERRNMEREWINQLENDEAWDTGTAARESTLWEYFTMIMDPTWCGQ
ncbi:hypothetical protein B0J11DRAFT_598455 [Dendryphion nanum]|uniref:F-box domain-containing protein n=1 Tax=Dendryphion nanum TaxID=256645 RepID=A0A9P9I9F4_9PLEO|nr:hypothetical protein B0J11DRAFT_598455 [Dendryphion nanum]